MRAYSDLDIRAMYGPENVDKFLKVRKEFDLSGMFSNDYMKKLFFDLDKDFNQYSQELSTKLSDEANDYFINIFSENNTNQKFVQRHAKRGGNLSYADLLDEERAN